MRIALSDNSGWFDSGTAVCFKEATWWDGNNHVSKATGSQWEHEALYYTTSDNWVLNYWSQWQGSEETYRQIDQDDAVAWLLANDGFDDDAFAELPEDVQAAARAAYDGMEV